MHKKKSPWGGGGMEDLSRGGTSDLTTLKKRGHPASLSSVCPSRGEAMSYRREEKRNCVAWEVRRTHRAPKGNFSTCRVSSHITRGKGKGESVTEGRREKGQGSGNALNLGEISGSSLFIKRSGNGRGRKRRNRGGGQFPFLAKDINPTGPVTSSTIRNSAMGGKNGKEKMNLKNFVGPGQAFTTWKGKRGRDHFRDEGTSEEGSTTALRVCGGEPRVGGLTFAFRGRRESPRALKEGEGDLSPLVGGKKIQKEHL